MKCTLYLLVICFWITACQNVDNTSEQMITSVKPLQPEPVDTTDLDSGAIANENLPQEKITNPTEAKPFSNANNKNESEDNNTAHAANEGVSDSSNAPQYNVELYHGKKLDFNEILKKHPDITCFNTSDTMQVRNTYLGQLVLATNKTLQNAIESMEEPAGPDSKFIADTSSEIKHKMRARLVDPAPSDDPNFLITPMGDDEQKLDDKTHKALWAWKIEPLKEGQHELWLNIAIVDNEGNASTQVPRKYNITIYSKPSSVFSNVAAFIGKNFQWMIASVMIPLLILWTNVRINKKRKIEEKKFEENVKEEMSRKA